MDVHRLFLAAVRSWRLRDEISRTLDMLKIKITGFETYSETHYLRNAYAYLTRDLLFHPTYSLHSRVIRLYLFMAFGVDYIMVRAGKSRNVQ